MARPPKITNEVILEAARQVFLEDGVGASTLTIAEKAGISEAAIFKRFGTKQAMFLAAMGISETPPWVKDLPRRQPSPAIKSELTELCHEMMAFYQVVLPRVMVMMVQNKQPFPPPLPPPPMRDTNLLAGFIERAITQGYIQSSQANQAKTVAHMIVGAIFNYVIMTTISTQIPIPLPFQSSSVDPKTFVEQLIETLWTGIAPDS
jgi:AcrR family transcriptional regulator